MNADEMQVIMFEIFEVAKVIQEQNCDYFTLGHFAGAITAMYAVFR
jgi:tRNA threonylcarbamoyladenosine modification (KEOPS) complex Cgi121 subunit